MMTELFPVLFPASVEQLKCIKDELGEVPNKMEVYEKNFKDWLISEEYLPNKIDTTVIQNYIRHSKFDLQRAKLKFEKYLVAKSKFPSYFERNFTKDQFVNQELHRYSFILPRMTKHGYRIFVMMLPDKSVDTFDPELSNRFTMMLCDYLIQNDVNAGVIFIFDLRYLSMQHITKTPIKMFVDFIRIATTVLPTRIREIHIFNMNSTAEKLLNICKAILTNKLKDRLFVHKTCEIQGYLSRDVLPIEFGGTCESIPEISTRWRLHIEENTGWIKLCEEVKLMGNVPTKRDDLCFREEFGADGCFRKLEID